MILNSQPFIDSSDRNVSIFFNIRLISGNLPWRNSRPLKYSSHLQQIIQFLKSVRNSWRTPARKRGSKKTTFKLFFSFFLPLAVIYFIIFTFSNKLKPNSSVLTSISNSRVTASKRSPRNKSQKCSCSTPRRAHSIDATGGSKSCLCANWWKN